MKNELDRTLEFIEKIFQMVLEKLKVLKLFLKFVLKQFLWGTNLALREKTIWKWRILNG